MRWMAEVFGASGCMHAAGSLPPRRASALVVVAGLLLSILTAVPAAAQDPEPAPKSEVGDRLLVIHDSVILGARRQIEAVFPETKVQYLGFGGFRVGPAADMLAGRPDLITDKVVVELGTNYLGNQTLFRRELDRLMGLLSGVEHVLWLTPSRYASRMDQVNTEIRAAADRYPNLQIGEWTYLTAADKDLTWGDGIHLQPRGAEAIAGLIHAHLTGAVEWNRQPVGRIEGLRDTSKGLRVSGWAYDPDLDQPVKVRITVNGELVAKRKAKRHKPAVAKTDLGRGLGMDNTTTKLGFAMKLKLPDGEHEVCIEANNFDGAGPRPLDCRTVAIDHSPFGSLEKVRSAKKGTLTVLSGWAIDPDRSHAIVLEVRNGDQVVAKGRANLARTDLDQFGKGSDHGFLFKVPTIDDEYCVVAINERAGSTDTVLGCTA